jgi:hypothetical protein
MSQTKQRIGRVGTLGACLAIAVGGAGFAGCGDEDEGPAEEAGQALDDAGEDVGNAAEDAGQEVDDNVDVDVGEDAGKGEKGD